MNKKGQLGMTLIFFVALAVSILAILSFYGFSRDYGEISPQLSEIMSESFFVHAYVNMQVEKIGGDVIVTGNTDLKKEFKKIANERRFSYLAAKPFYDKIDREEFEFEKTVGGYVFRMEDLSIDAEREGNKIKKTFDLTVNFDSSGKIN